MSTLGTALARAGALVTANEVEEYVRGGESLIYAAAAAEESGDWFHAAHVADSMIARAVECLPPCDRCDRPNPRHAEGNLCADCRAAFVARTAGDPEYRPVGAS